MRFLVAQNRTHRVKVVFKCRTNADVRAVKNNLKGHSIKWSRIHEPKGTPHFHKLGVPAYFYKDRNHVHWTVFVFDYREEPEWYQWNHGQLAFSSGHVPNYLRVFDFDKFRGILAGS